MSKLVFFCIPAHGHTNPTLAVVRELVRRGHEVRYYSYEPFREKIEAAGAQFIPCDAYDAELSLDERDAGKVGKDLALSTHLLVETTLSLDEAVLGEMAEYRPDCIIADSMAVWGKLAARKLGIPFISSTTTFAFNQHSSRLMKQSIGQIFGLIFSMGKINADIVRLRERGYEVASVIDLIQNPNDTSTIVYTSPEFQPCAETFSDCYSFVGPMMRPVLAEFEKTADKLVYISMGTVVDRTLKFFRNCIKAFAGCEYQVVISVGNKIDIAQLGELPANVTVYPFVEQLAVLEKADAFITHCGMNSASEALWYGVPLVTFPQTPEQGVVAHQAEVNGAGVRLKSISHTEIRKAVDLVINDASYKRAAEVISRSFRKCGGAEMAADKIERESLHKHNE